jgi:hypothetical protein
LSLHLHPAAQAQFERLPPRQQEIVRRHSHGQTFEVIGAAVYPGESSSVSARGQRARREYIQAIAELRRWSLGAGVDPDDWLVPARDTPVPPP